MVSVPINFILLVFTWLSFTSHNNNHKVLIHFFVETSSTRAETLLACLELVSDSVANPPLCLVSGPIAIATQRPYLLTLDPSPKLGGILFDCQLSILQLTSIIGLIQKEIQTGVVKTYFLQKIPGIFRFATLSLEILEKTKLLLRKFHKIVLQPLGIPRPKSKTHGKFK